MLDNSNPDNPEGGYADWLAAGETRRYRSQRRQTILPPWDEMPYFDLPTIKTVSLVGGEGWVQLWAADSHRIAIVFNVQSTATLFLTPDPTIPVGTGIQLAASVQPFIIHQSLAGNLTQCEWYVSNSLAASIASIAVVLREYPR